MNLNISTLNATIMAINQTMPPRPSRGRSLNIANVVIAFAAIVLNIVEMLMIVCKKRTKPFERILLSLCVADIAVSISYVIEKLYETVNKNTLYGSQLHLVRPIVEYFAITSSITNIIALGVDRLIAIRYPLKHKVWITKRKIHVMIFAAWLLSIALSLLCNTNRFINVNRKSKRTAAYIFVALVLTFGLMITILYGTIIATVLRRKKMFRNMRGERSLRGSETSVTITCVNVVVVFSICTYPHMVDFAIDELPTLPIKFVLLNSMLDPIVYYFRGYIKKKLNERSRHLVDVNIVLTNLTPAGTPTPVRKLCHAAQKQTTETVLN